LTRTLTIVGVTLALLLGTATSADAARFVGSGVEDPKVGISFVKEDGRIKRFTIEDAKFRCTDGDRFRAGTQVGTMRLKEQDGIRVFSGSFTNDTETQTARVKGELRSRGRARGDFRLVATYDKVGCSTGTVLWEATRE
jgi:hypothetical protein